MSVNLISNYKQLHMSCIKFRNNSRERDYSKMTDQSDDIEHGEKENPGVEKADERPGFLDEEDSEDDDFVVTIGDIKTNVPFQKQHRGGAIGGTVDLDATPALKDGTPIYDLDLATMEDKPWRKPGADMTDYFNYGFNEDTWNQYCERQRKFRQEFGNDQGAINKAILSNIQLSGPAQLGLNTFSGGRQLVNLSGGQDSKLQQNKVQKIVVDLSKPPPSMGPGNAGSEFTNANPIPLMRTVINETGVITRQESASELLAFQMEGATSSQSQEEKKFVHMARSPPPTSSVNNTHTSKPISVINFTKPPPAFDPAMPPPMSIVSQIPTVSSVQPPSVQQQALSIHQTQRFAPTNTDLPPGVEEIDSTTELPPGVSRLDYSQPPPAPASSQFSYNPPPFSLTTTFGAGGPPRFNLPQQQPFSSRPPPLFQPSFRHPFGGFGSRFHEPKFIRGNRGRPDDRSSDSDGDSVPTHRKRRMSHSRSRSPPSRRHKEEKHKDREHKEKEGKKKRDKEKKEKHKSHRSPSQKKEKESKSIKSERKSSEREKDDKESSSRRRSSPKRRNKEGSSKSDAVNVKIERKSPES